VLIGFKPAVDAYNIAKGKKQEKGQSLDPLAELTVMKEVEMFAESIPGVIIQLMAIANGGGDVAAWVSIMVSALTTGYGGAVISYDWDTDPEKREQVPDFYGYVPSNPRQRSLVFVTMVLFGAGMLMIRCLTIVLLGMIGMSWALAYIGLDLGLYLAVKMLRGDFWYWVPLGGNAEIVSSIVARILVKVITDFTSIVQFRHPYELGGMYWSFGFVLTMVSLPVAITVYAEQIGATSVVNLAWRLLYILIPSTLVMFGVFFINIEKEYRHTFYSTERGKELTIRSFTDSIEDVTKAHNSIKKSKHLWMSLEEEVRSWVESNWSRWEDEKPKWLDENMKAKIPVKWIPTKEAQSKE